MLQVRNRVINNTLRTSAIIRKGYDEKLGRWIQQGDKYILADEEVITGIAEALAKYKEADPKANENDLIRVLVKLNKIELGIKKLMSENWRHKQVIAYLDGDIITLCSHEIPKTEKELRDCYGNKYMAFDVPDIGMIIDKNHPINPVLKGKLYRDTGVRVIKTENKTRRK